MTTTCTLNEGDFVSYHGSITKYTGMVCRVVNVVLSANDLRMEGMFERFSIQGIGGNSDEFLHNVRPSSVTLVKAA